MEQRMIYKQYTGQPNQIPKGATYLGETLTHYQSYTEWIRWYSDTPNDEKDIAEFQNAKQVANDVNSRDIPIWV
jgi:hypothetical protein